MKVLIVEDDLDIARLIEIHLKDLGYEVELQSNGKKGLETALAKEFDLIILDLMLPDMEGTEMCAGGTKALS